MDKVCRDCGQTKPVSEYFKSPRNAGGYSPTCKPCYMVRQARYRMKPPKDAAPNGMKRCWSCKETKPTAEFPKSRDFHDGLNRACRACLNARSRAWRNQNLAQLKEYRQARYRSDPERFADYELKKSYGIAPGTYAKMLSAQSGKCAICGTDDPGSRSRRRTRRFAVDHCHDTGAVRGLLCGNCNRGIGYLKHSIDALRAAVKYLSESSSTGGS